ncbi:MAG: UbiA family prenyltransferase [Planctomycetota bacterium]
MKYSKIKKGAEIEKENDHIAVFSGCVSEELAAFLHSIPFLKYFVSIFALFQMSRPGIVAVVLLTPASAAFLATNGFPAIIPSIFGTLTICLAVASAHIFNDYCDVEVDKINPRACWRPLVKNLVSRKQALFASILLAIASVTCAAILNWTCAVILLFGIGFIYSYSAYFKGTVWGFLPPALAAFIIPLGGFGAYNASAAFSKPAILMGLVGFFFELIPYWSQTIPDIEGDKTRKLPTIAVKYGASKTAATILITYLPCMVFMWLLGKEVHLSGLYFLIIICGGAAVALTIIFLLFKPAPSRALALYFTSLIFIGIVSVVIILEKAYYAKEKYFDFGRQILDFLEKNL